MADDLISRQAAIKLLRGECVAKYPSSFCFGLSAAADELSKLPTVDAVEVVRCGECRICGTSDCPMSGTAGRVSASDFCSYGIRREDNG